jgi:RNA polymerase sigma factor (sigma-70 family)
VELETIADIIEGCIKREAKYQRMMYNRFRGFACKLVFRYIYRYEKAIDVVNDGFIKAFNHFDQFKKGESSDLERQLMGWLKKIMINCSIDELRKKNMLPEIGGIGEEVWQLPANDYNADRLLLYRDLIMIIKELPPHYRVVFNLYVIDGYSHAEIAELLNISIGTSKSSLSRARSILQKTVRNLEESKVCRI